MTLFLPALLYFLFAVQLYVGKPVPLYGKPGFSKSMGLAFLNETPALRRLAYCAFALLILICLFVLTHSPLPLWLGALIALGGGVIARFGLKQEGRHGSLSLSPRIGRSYPFWLFDLWTIGLTLILSVTFLS